MNLWSLDGTGTQLGLADDEMVQVVIDDFVYTPSGETHVSNGGSCVKDCQCAPSSECNRGTCVSVSGGPNAPPPTTPKPTAPPVAANTPTKSPTTKMPTPFTTNTSAQCSAHPDCSARKLAGDCCPVSDAIVLSITSLSFVCLMFGSIRRQATEPFSHAARRKEVVHLLQLL